MGKRRLRRCAYCYRVVDVQHPKSYLTVSRKTLDGYAYDYLYHNDCWTKKRDRETMREYRRRLRDTL